MSKNPFFTLPDYKKIEHELINLIRNRLGLIIHEHQVNTLCKTIQEACNKFKCSPSTYFDLLTKTPDQSPLTEHLIAGITVGETYFFRDKQQMNLLKSFILPRIINAKRSEDNLRLRIWSAGCASGEEIYTIAMMLNELLNDMSEWTLTLLGTDINTDLLRKAVEGHYGEWSMRSIDDYYKRKYFTKRDHFYVIEKNLRDIVKFDYLNLNDDIYPSIINATNSQDLILCRNVLIYFDSKQTSLVMKKLSNCLAPEGYLLLGASDPIDIKSTNLSFHQAGSVLFSNQPIQHKPTNIKPANIITKKETIQPIKMQAHPKQSTQIKDTPNLKEDSLRLKKLLSESKWHEILNLIDKHKDGLKNSTFLMSSKAVALANLGKPQEAVELLEESFKLEPNNKLNYFTYALALLELNKSTQAEQALRKSLYLDHQFVLAHYQLGLLSLRNKNYFFAIKCIKNALAIAESIHPDEKVEGSYQLSFGKLSEILKHELDFYLSIRNDYDVKDTHTQNA